MDAGMCKAHDSEYNAKNGPYISFGILDGLGIGV